MRPLGQELAHIVDGCRDVGLLCAILDPVTSSGTGQPAASPSSPATPELGSLAHAAQAGSEAAAEQLLERVRVIAHGYCRAKLATYPGAYHLVDDVAQEVCLAVLGALPRYRDLGRPFEAFVYGIASRKVADAQRALARHPLPVADLPDDPDHSPTPEDRAVAASDVKSAAEILGWLPDNLRELLLLRVGSELSAEETGAALGMTAGAVRVAQHRALTKMRDMARRRQQAGG